MTVLKLWIERFGIPQALYCDKKNAFVLTREPTDAELLAGITKPKSHFGRACDKLGIEVIPANSPQAKGRVERNHRLDQDRMVKELRLAGISTIEDANKFLAEYYLPKMKWFAKRTSKFYKEPRCKDDAHVPLGKTDLSAILCEEHQRVVTNDVVAKATAWFGISAIYTKSSKRTGRGRDRKTKSRSGSDSIIRYRLFGRPKRSKSRSLPT